MTGKYVHRYARGYQSGIYCCGAKERDGEVCSMVFRFVTCPACKKITAEKRDAAKLRSRVFIMKVLAK